MGASEAWWRLKLNRLNGWEIFRRVELVGDTQCIADKQAQQRGFDYFHILQASSGANYVTTGGPTTFVNTGGGTVMALPGPATTHARPTGSIMVRFYKTRPDAPNVWEARAVLAEK